MNDYIEEIKTDFVSIYCAESEIYGLNFFMFGLVNKFDVNVNTTIKYLF